MMRARSNLRRRLFMESLEDRRMLAIAGDLTGGLLKFTGDAGANQLSIVNVVGSTYVISSTTDNITLTDNDGTLVGIVGSGTPAVTFSAPPGAVNNLSVDLAGGSDTVALAGMTAAASNGLKSLTISDSGAAGTDNVQLAGDVDIDGNFTLSSVENLLLATSATIDTEQGGDNNAGNVDLGGAATSANAVALDLTIDATTSGASTPGTITLGVFSNAPGPQFVHHLTIAGPSTTVITGDMHTSGDQVFNGDTLLASDATLTATNVVFAGTLNDDGVVATPSSLTINTSGGGLTEFGSAVGGTSALTGITTNADGFTLIAASVHTTIDQIYNDPVTIGGDATLTANNANFADKLDDDGNAGTTSNLTINAAGVTFAGAVGGTAALTSLTTDAAGSTAINGGSVKTSGSQTYNDAVTLGANTVLTSTGGGNINLASTVDGPFTLDVNTAGTTTFGDVVGGTTALTSLTTDAAGSVALNGGSVTTAGAQTYNDAATLGATTTLTSTAVGNLTFASTVNGASTLAMNTAGTTTLGGAVGNTLALLSVTTDGAGSTAINGGSVTTTGGQSYNDAVTLGANTVLSSTGAGNVSFASTVNGAFTLTINAAGTTTFGGAVGNTTALTSVTTDAPGSTALNGGAVTTTGGQTYNDAVTLGANTLLTSNGAGNITLASTVNGPFSLTVNTAGTTTFGGAVGGATALTSVTTDAAGSKALNGGSVTTTGAQAYNDAVTLGADTVLTSTGAGNITLANTVNGAFTLTVNTAGTTTLGGAVGGTTALVSVTTDAAGSTALNGGSVTTAVSQTYNDAVTLGANTVLTSTGGGNITLASTVNGAFTLSVNTAGATTFGGPVGGTTALTSLTIDASGTTAINGGAITTTGAQTYNDAVTLGANTLLTSTGAGNISFASTVNGAFSLTVNTTGVTTFGGAVGGTTALTSVTTDAAGSTAINGGTVTTSGAQAYNDPVTLGAATTLTSTGSGNITFASTLNGAFTLAVNTAGTTTFGGIVGGTAPLVNLTMDAGGTTQINGGGAVTIHTTGDQTYNDNVTLGADTTLTGNNFVFAATGSLNGAAAGKSLAINAAGTVNFNGPVGNTVPLNNLTVTANGVIAAAANITTTGAILFTATETASSTNNVTVASGVTLHSTGSSIEFDAGDDIHIIGTAKLMAATTVTLKVDVGNADAGVGQNLTIDTTATIITAGGTFLVGGSDNDTITFPSLPGTTFDVKAGAGNDTITVINKNPDGTAKLVTIDGQADGAPTDMATIRQGGTINTTKRPYFLPNTTAVSIADKVFWDDTGATHVFGLPTGDIDKINGNSIVRNGNMELSYTNIELLNLKTGPGNDDVTADMTAGPLPHIVQIQDTGGPDNRFQVEGTAAADNISIGDIGTTLITSGGPLRASFELAGFNRQWVRGNGGNDVIDNISKVPGVLDGGAGDDTINSIVNVANSKLILTPNILNSTINNVTLVLGNLGHDKLFVGSGAVDGPLAAGSVAAALKAFPDKSITFLIGDYKANAAGNHLIQVVAGGEPGDTYFSSSSAFQHGFVALKDTTPSKGIFKFGAGDTIRFSSTIAWLKAQIFVKASLNKLIDGPLSRQLAAYTKVVGPTAEGESSFDDISGDAAVSAPILAATTDVNRDGQITPLDALLIINELNARGSRQLPPLPNGEGEDSLDDMANPQPIFDVNGDGYLSPSDALAVINVLNAFPADSAAAPSDSTTAAVDTLMQSPTTATQTATSTPTQPAINISDALMSLMAIDSSTASKKKSP